MTSQVAYEPVRRTLLLRVLGSLAFGALAIGVGIWAVQGDQPRPISAALLIVGGGYFSFLSVAFLRQLFERWGLTADDEAFSYTRLWTRARVRWRDVSEFRIVKLRAIRVIGFDLVDAPETAARRLNRQTLGVSDYIFAHSFSAPLEEVCKQLNALRQRALESPSVQ